MYVLNVVVLVLSFTILGVQCLSEEMLELANMLHQQCQEETGVPEELIQAGRKGEFSDDNKFKCYLHCLMHAMAVIDEDDWTIDEDSMIGLLPEEHKELGTKVVRACGTKKGSDICDTAWLTNKCYYQQAPDDYYLP